MIKRNDGISKDDICQNQFTAYVVLAVKRKRQSYIKKKQREHEKETRTKKEAEQSEFRTAGYDMWSRMEPQNEKLMAAMQQLSLKERFVVTEYVLKGKPFKEIAQETGLKEKGVASAYYRSIKKLRAEMGDHLHTERRLSYPEHRYPQDQAPRTLRQTSQGVSGNAPSDTVQ